VGVLRGLMDQAVDARLRRDNPAKDVKMPRRAAHVDRVLAPDEDELLLASLDRQFPGRPDARLFVEVLLYCGLRYEEAAAIDREHVDLRRGLIHVGPVLERDGTIRPYPKSPAGVRDVPVADHLWPRLRSHAMSVHPAGASPRSESVSVGPDVRAARVARSGGRPGLLFTAAKGAPLNYSSWLRRVWHRGLHEVVERGPRNIVSATRQILDDPQPTPHDLRHTFGTRLGDAQLGVHEIMALMGHETLESAQRYLHAGEDRFGRARDAMRRARGM
jgi:integrase